MCFYHTHYTLSNSPRPMLLFMPTQIYVSFKKNIKHSLYFPYTLNGVACHWSTADLPGATHTERASLSQQLSIADSPLGRGDTLCLLSPWILRFCLTWASPGSLYGITTVLIFIYAMALLCWENPIFLQPCPSLALPTIHLRLLKWSLNLGRRGMWYTCPI